MMIPMVTKTVTILPVVKALAQLVIFTGVQTHELPDTWHQKYITCNEQQKILMSQYAPAHKELSKFIPEELSVWASNNHEALNAILESKKFDIRLAALGQNGFGAVSVLDIKTQWKHKGRTTKIICPGSGVRYHAVCINNSDTYRVFETKHHPHPVAAFRTQSDDVVYLTEATEQLDGLKLLDMVRKIGSDLIETYDYQGVMFPKADINNCPDMSWMEGIALPEGCLEQIKQQIKFKLDEEGAQVESAFACGTRCIPVYMEITCPYFVWWSRPGVSMPVVAALVAHDSWQKDRCFFPCEILNLSPEEKEKAIASAQVFTPLGFVREQWLVCNNEREQNYFDRDREAILVSDGIACFGSNEEVLLSSASDDEEENESVLDFMGLERYS